MTATKHVLTSADFPTRFSTTRGLLLAALCVFLAAAFVFDVLRGASLPDRPAVTEPRT